MHCFPVAALRFSAKASFLQPRAVLPDYLHKAAVLLQDTTVLHRWQRFRARADVQELYCYLALRLRAGALKVRLRQPKRAFPRSRIFSVVEDVELRRGDAVYAFPVARPVRHYAVQQVHVVLQEAQRHVFVQRALVLQQDDACAADYHAYVAAECPVDCLRDSLPHHLLHGVRAFPAVQCAVQRKEVLPSVRFIPAEQVGEDG